MSINLKLNTNHRSCLRDPESTELGQKIISESIRLIDELGFEQFTFKKLAAEIQSTEASVYRYFENKHKLLVYLVSWYWAWLNYQVTFSTNNISSPRERLIVAIRILADFRITDFGLLHVQGGALHRIIEAEAAKVYLTKAVDEDNREGLFGEYKQLCSRLSAWVTELNPNYPYPHALISTVLEEAQRQLFFAHHLPSLTDVPEQKKKETGASHTAAFLEHLVLAALSSTDNGTER